MNAIAALDDTSISDHGAMPERNQQETTAGPKRQTRPAPFWEESGPLVLIADPDPDAPVDLLAFCRDHGVRTAIEGTGAGALIEYGRIRPDVVLLSDMIRDVPWGAIAAAMMAKGPSPVVLVRGAFSSVPTADDEELPEIVTGYDQAIESAAMRGVLGRLHGPSPRDAEIVYGSLVMRPAAFDVRDGGRPVPLTLREFELLRVLMLAQGQAVGLDQLKSDVWGAVGQTVKTQTLKVHMNRIRSKLTGPVRPTAVRGIGYVLKLL